MEKNVHTVFIYSDGLVSRRDKIKVKKKLSDP